MLLHQRENLTVQNNCSKLICVMTSQYETNFWSTHVSNVQLSFFCSHFTFCAAKTENPITWSFFALKPNGNDSYAGYFLNWPLCQSFLFYASLWVPHADVIFHWIVSCKVTVLSSLSNRDNKGNEKVTGNLHLAPSFEANLVGISSDGFEVLLYSACVNNCYEGRNKGYFHS